LKAYWFNEWDNAGDAVVPLMLEKLTGEKPEHTLEGARFLSCGSLLQRVNEGDTLWGTGCLKEEFHKKVSKLNILALRGPRTRAVIDKYYELEDEIPEVYGDAGILAPRLLGIEKQKPKADLALIPHVHDIERALKRFGDRNILLDVRKSPVVFMDAISECKCVLSSSLHGIVFAEAMGIPAGHVNFHTPEDDQHSWKFADYYEGTDRKLKHTHYLFDDSDIDRAVKCLEEPPSLEQLGFSRLMGVSPFRR
jgi:pyruvyltransferase